VKRAKPLFGAEVKPLFDGELVMDEVHAARLQDLRCPACRARPHQVCDLGPFGVGDAHPGRLTRLQVLLIKRGCEACELALRVDGFVRRTCGTHGHDLCPPCFRALPTESVCVRTAAGLALVALARGSAPERRAP
jgi:hypothetical protein